MEGIIIDSRWVRTAPFPPFPESLARALIPFAPMDLIRSLLFWTWLALNFLFGSCQEEGLCCIRQIFAHGDLKGLLSMGKVQILHSKVRTEVLTSSKCLIGTVKQEDFEGIEQSKLAIVVPLLATTEARIFGLFAKVLVS